MCTRSGETRVVQHRVQGISGLTKAFRTQDRQLQGTQLTTIRERTRAGDDDTKPAISHKYGSMHQIPLSNG